MLSARNQFKGIVKSVKLGGIMAEVVVNVGGVEIVSVITRSSAEGLGLKARGYGNCDNQVYRSLMIDK